MGIAAVRPATLALVQEISCGMEVAVERHSKNNGKSEAIDTSSDQQDSKSKSICNWCGYKSHYEQECRQKAADKSKKGVSGPTVNNNACSLIKYFRCGRTSHCIVECKVKVVFSSEDAKDNKDITQYACTKSGEGDKGELSESGSVLRGKGREGSYDDDPLHSSKSILPLASKPTLILPYSDGLREREGVTRGGVGG
jgi:hypothetical protein